MDKKHFALALAIIFSAIAIAVSGCDQRRLVEGDTRAWIVRPGGGAEAIVSRVSTNATVSFGYRVYIRGTAPNADAVEVLRMDKSDPPRVSWTGRTTLFINARCGQIFQFTNFAIIPEEGSFRKIFIVLQNRSFCK